MGIRWQCREGPELPTTTIYFTNAMAAEIGPYGSARPVWRVSPNAFLIPAPAHPQLLIIRHVDGPAQALLQQLPHARVHYLLDDDIWAGISDTNLPLAYRKRLFILACRIRAITARAERVYVTSQALNMRFGTKARTVSPGLVQAVKPASLDDCTPLRIVFPGTRARLQDLASIADPLARFLRQHPACSLHTFLGDSVPAKLRLANTVHHKPQDWFSYRKTLERKQFHVGIVPALPTDVNAARSHNKILELAAYGAAPIYGTGLAFRRMAADAGASLLCERQDDWFHILSALVQNRDEVRRLANANAKLALQLGDPAKLRSFWLEELGLTSALESAAA